MERYKPKRKLNGHAQDAEFKESDHPRQDDGKFGSGGGGRKGKSRAVEFTESPHSLAKYKGAPDLSSRIVSVADAKKIRNKLQESGRLNPDGRTVSLYHVTTSDVSDKIKEGGLIPGASEASGQDWKAEHSDYATYFHSDKDIADDQAAQSGGVVVKADIPITPKTLIRMLPDEDFSDNPEDGVKSLLDGGPVAFIGGVPPNAVSVGKAYPDPAEDEAIKRAAGVIFTTPDDRILLVERSDKGDAAHTWCFPGGMLEGDEEPVEAARREAEEETGYGFQSNPEFKPYHKATNPDGLEYTTFIVEVPEAFEPELNDECSDSVWCSPDDLPDPLHPGVAKMFGSDMSEADWDGLEAGLAKWIGEEREESEHAQDEAFLVRVEGESGTVIKELPVYAANEAAALHQAVLKKIRGASQYHVSKADQAHDAKLQHDEVQYGPGKPKSHCSICEYYLKPDHCQLVVDPIEAQGWCKLFTKEQKYAVDVNRDYDGPWISCMSKDGQRMYVNRNVPETVDIHGQEVDVDEDLLHHEIPELQEIQTLLAQFAEEHSRKPTTEEKKQLYLKAHHTAGTPSERQYCKERGIDWDALSAWYRGQEAKIAKLTPKKLPPDADVRPIPHRHGDLEIAVDVSKRSTIYGPVDPVYKGYLIKKLMGDNYSIQRDEHHIGYASSIEDAKKKIDEVVGDSLGSDSKAEPEHTLEIQYDGDFDMAGFLRMLHLMGGHGSSRGVIIDDDEDYEFRSTWDGDGADKIHSAMIDGVDILKAGAEDEESKFKEEDHPRREDGKFGSGGGGSSKGKAEKGKEEQSSAKSSKTLGPKYSKEAKIVDGVIHTSNVDDAVLALYEDRKVELDQPRQVTVLLEKLAAEAKRMKEAGEDAPVFNLCNVTVKKTNLFCADAHGIPRVKMPQLDEGPGGADGFRDYLKNAGYDVEETTEKAQFLRATQNELNGAQVAALAKIFESGGRKSYTVFVSRDNYIIDGHHRWAAEIGVEYESGKDVNINIERVDGGIIELLAQANKFTKGKGKVGVGQTQAIKGKDSLFGPSPEHELERHHHLDELEVDLSNIRYRIRREHDPAKVEALYWLADKKIAEIRKAQHAGDAEDVEFEESKHPRGKGGKFTSGAGHVGGGGEELEPEEEGEFETFYGKPIEGLSSGSKKGLSHHAKKVQAFLSQPNASKVMADAVNHFFKKHGMGALHLSINMNVIKPALHGAIGVALGHMGASVPEIAAMAVAFYAVHHLAEKVGFNSETAVKALTYVGSALIHAHEIGQLKSALGGDAKPKEDEVITALKRFVNILKTTPLEKLEAAAKKSKPKKSSKRAEDAPKREKQPWKGYRKDESEALRTKETMKGFMGATPEEEAQEERAWKKHKSNLEFKRQMEKKLGRPIQLEEWLRIKRQHGLDEALWLALDHYLIASRGTEKYAFDKSVREYDADGRLHVTVANISKANVCPYMGKEIPDEDGTLRLDPDKIYQLLRDPEELAAAASTFNGIPVLREHTPVSADDHQPDEVIGATGTDAEFVDPYLRNSLVIWVKDDIDEVKSNKKREISCGYRYQADMTPGIFKGVRYDGVMRNIVGNHIVTCIEGRSGSDIRIGDKVPEALRWAAIEEAILQCQS